MEDRIRTLFWTHNRPKFTFDDFTSEHLELHGIQDALKKRGIYPGMTEERRVDFYLAGIRNDRLDGPKSMCMTNPELYSNFSKCASHLKKFINLDPNLKTVAGRQSNISAVGHYGPGRGGGGPGRGGQGPGRGRGGRA